MREEKIKREKREREIGMRELIKNLNDKFLNVEIINYLFVLAKGQI